MSYDVHIPRCTHIKTNGTQCGSPALRGRRFCFFHKNWQGQRIQLNVLPAAPLSFTMPVPEDAESVQVALMQVMRLILAGQIEPKMAGLMLYALQTASANLRHMKLEPYKLEKIVIDPRTVGDNGLGDDAWCEEEFEEDEEEDEDDEDSEDEDTDEDDDEEPVRVARAACPERAEGPSPASSSGTPVHAPPQAGPERSEESAAASNEPADVMRAALRASASKLVSQTRAGAPALQRPPALRRPPSPASQPPPAPKFKRPPGAAPNAIVVDFDGDGLARHLLQMFDFEPRPPK